MTRTLLVITTANQLEYTRASVRSVEACAFPGLDLLIVDDCSDDGTVEHLHSEAVRVLTKRCPKGLTDSWNRAYREFVAGDYDVLILGNNDILVPRGAIEHLVTTLHTRVLVGVMSTARGVGHQPAQAVRAIHPELPVDETDPSNVQRVQDHVGSARVDAEALPLPYANGFFFGVTRDIRTSERTDGNLFDPQRTNTGNEDELCRRLGSGAQYVCTRAFVFHYKGITLDLARRDRDKQWGGRNMLWTTARELFG